MENKHVGWLVVGISIVIVGIIFLFNNAMQEIVAEGCPLQFHDGARCPAYRTIEQQTYLSLAIVGVLIVLGAVLTLSKPGQKAVIRRVGKLPRINALRKKESLTSEERGILELLSKSGPAFQATLIEQSGFGKAKMTRVLDRLENRGFVERKRRGMTNIVVLREHEE